MSSPSPVSKPPPPSSSQPPPRSSSAPPPSNSQPPPQSSTPLPPPPNSILPPPPPPPNSILSPPPPPNSGTLAPPPPNSGTSAPPPPNSGMSPPPPPNSGMSPPPPPPLPSSPPPTTPSSSPPPLPPALPPTNPPPPTPSPPPVPPPMSPPQTPPVTPPASPSSSPPPPPSASSPPPPPAASSSPPPPTASSSPPPPTASSSPPPPISSSPPPPRTPVVSPPPSSTPVSPPPAPVKLSPPPPTGSPVPPATPSVSQPPPPLVPSPPSPLYDRSPPTPLFNQSPPPPPSKSSSSSTAVIVGGVAAAGVVIALLLGIFVFFRWRRRRRSPSPAPSLYADIPHGPYYTQSPAKFTSSGATPPPTTRRESGPDTPLMSPSSPGIFLNFAKTSFTYGELEMATDGFSEANLLGRGGFGHVYKGTFDGKEFAVKKLTAGSGQGDREFLAEVEKLSRVHHKHLVSLVGYCISGSQRMLVYEYLPNNTLEFHLHVKGQPALEWSIRFKIAVGSAKGLAYLHEDCRPKIIHRDIKAANILLDSDFEAKVSDFGLAKFQVEGDTHISTRVVGTFGYLAPEYAVSGKLTDKSDVFSMGVMMLELITGRRPVFSSQSYMDETLVGWARPLLTEAVKGGNYEALVDPRLENNYDPNEMLRLVACAAACVRQSAKLRPRMSEVVRFLQGELSLDVLHGEVLPGYSALQSTSSQEHMSRLRRMAFANQEDMTSSIYSVPSTRSEFNRNLDSSSLDNDPFDREITDSNKSTAEFSAKI